MSEAGLADSTRRVPGDQRIAIVHEWIDAYAGSEQVFEALAAAFPTADLFALSRQPSVDLETGGRPIKTSFLDRPALRARKHMVLPLMPVAWRAIGPGEYDVVISSHHAFAHANRLARVGGAHLCYVHTPARYLWSPEIDERGAAWYLSAARAALRRVDLSATRRVTAYAANSTNVAERIDRFWGRRSTVIHPPVRTEFFGEPASTPPTRDYILGFGRWIPYKNLHVVIEAGDAAGMPVKIAGRGPDRSRIVAAAEAATVPVELIHSPDDFQLRELYRNAACLVFPTIEDFGMVPVEAQATGTPVVALAAGGALDTIVDGLSGILIPTLDRSVFAQAISRAMHLDPILIAKHANNFSESAFRERIHAWIRDTTQGPTGSSIGDTVNPQLEVRARPRNDK